MNSVGIDALYFLHIKLLHSSSNDFIVHPGSSVERALSCQGRCRRSIRLKASLRNLRFFVSPLSFFAFNTSEDALSTIFLTSNLDRRLSKGL